MLSWELLRVRNSTHQYRTYKSSYWSTSTLSWCPFLFFQIKIFWLWLKYLPTATLLAGVKAGKLHQSHFNVNQYNYLEINVPVPAFTKPVLLIGRENMNRAVNGDVVVIEIFWQEGMESTSWWSCWPGWYECFLTFWVSTSDSILATLKNDDAEDSGEEGDEENHEILVKESRHIQSEK
jgi:exosome complex exonuclease DIS3/RRP44